MSKKFHKDVHFFSQLNIAEIWGQELADRICGPLALYCFVNGVPETKLESQNEYLEDLEEFIKIHFPDLTGSGIMLEELITGCTNKQALDMRIEDLDRTNFEANFVGRIQNLIDNSRKLHGVGLLQIGSYFGETVDGKNNWQRCIGHFVVLDEVGEMKGPLDPYFQARIWDPWDGNFHSVQIYEEQFRNFTALDFNNLPNMKTDGLTNSPNGFEVQSPYLCVFAPHMDLYDADVYFTQRMHFVVERAYI